MKRFVLLVVALTVAPAALAYIGPGAGISLLGSIFSIVGAIFLAVFAVLLWPIRKMFKRRKKARAAKAQMESAGSTSAEGDADAAAEVAPAAREDA